LSFSFIYLRRLGAAPTNAAAVRVLFEQRRHAFGPKKDFLKRNILVNLNVIPPALGGRDTFGFQ
jgi:hypothetical protein